MPFKPKKGVIGTVKQNLTDTKKRKKAGQKYDEVKMKKVGEAWKTKREKMKQKTNRYIAAQESKRAIQEAVQARKSKSATAKTISRSSGGAVAATSTSASSAESSKAYADQAKYEAEQAKYQALITANINGENGVDPSKPGSGTPKESSKSTSDNIIGWSYN